MSCYCCSSLTVDTDGLNGQRSRKIDILTIAFNKFGFLKAKEDLSEKKQYKFTAEEIEFIGNKLLSTKDVDDLFYFNAVSNEMYLENADLVDLFERISITRTKIV